MVGPAVPYAVGQAFQLFRGPFGSVSPQQEDVGPGPVGHHREVCVNFDSHRSQKLLEHLPQQMVPAGVRCLWFFHTVFIDSGESPRERERVHGTFTGLPLIRYNQVFIIKVICLHYDNNHFQINIA